MRSEVSGRVTTHEMCLGASGGRGPPRWFSGGRGAPVFLDWRPPGGVFPDGPGRTGSGGVRLGGPGRPGGLGCTWHMCSHLYASGRCPFSQTWPQTVLGLSRSSPTSWSTGCPEMCLQLLGTRVSPAHPRPSSPPEGGAWAHPSFCRSAGGLPLHICPWAGGSRGPLWGGARPREGKGCLWNVICLQGWGDLFGKSGRLCPEVPDVCWAGGWW